MNKAIWNAELTRRDVLKLGAFALVLPRDLFASDDDAWSFAVFSDTHFGVAGNEEKNNELLRELIAHAPELAIDAGDVTERAWPEEFDMATHAFAGVPFKTYCAPGNHDVRWAPRGLTMFTERVGAPHQLFQHRGCAFLLVDSTVPLSHWGHIGGPQQRWIREQLAQIDRATPLFVFLHHAVGRPGGASVDDSDVLAEALAGYNTKIVFTGHGHADLLWDWNGIPTTMGKGLYQGSYQIAKVDPVAGNVQLYRRTGTPELKPLTTVPLAANPNAIRITATPAALAPAAAPLRLAWQQKLGGGVMSHLLLDDGLLYVSGMDGALYAFRAKDGTALWQSKTGGYCFSSPVIAGDLVIVGSADGYAYAFDRKRGTQRWRVQTNGPVYGSAAAAKGIAAIASGDGIVYGIGLKDGVVRWRYTLPPGPSAFSQSPAVTDGERIYFGAWDEYVYALDATTGREVWRYRATDKGFYFSAAIAKPAIARGRVYVPANQNLLHAIDARTGARIWAQAAAGDKFGYSSPVIVGDRLYVGSLGDKGEVHCLNAETGENIWTTATGATIYESSPAVTDGVVAIGSVNGTLSVLRASDGALLTQYKFPAGLFVSSPAAHDKRIYAATFAEVVGAFDILETHA